MRDGTQLRNEQRQRGQGYDAEFEAMRPFEQSQPLTRNRESYHRPCKQGNRLPATPTQGWFPLTASSVTRISFGLKKWIIAIATM
jgi:hypothetical protein